ncbi:uncharacterized protein LOC144665391 [Oculina patagonica]
MQSKEDFFTSYSCEKEIERAKWYKNDLGKGGWEELHSGPGNVYWIKTIPGEEVPMKVLSCVDMPLSAEMYMEVIHPRNLEKRVKWDRTFLNPSSFPLWESSFVMFIPLMKEIDWFGKQAFIAIDSSGGNFTVIIPHEKEPSEACSLFLIYNNKFSDWMPSKNVETIIGKKISASFNQYLASMVEGYNKYFKEN